jgi:hypothetical protein
MARRRPYKAEITVLVPGQRLHSSGVDWTSARTDRLPTEEDIIWRDAMDPRIVRLRTNTRAVAHRGWILDKDTKLTSVVKSKSKAKHGTARRTG